MPIPYRSSVDQSWLIITVSLSFCPALEAQKSHRRTRRCRASGRVAAFFNKLEKPSGKLMDAMVLPPAQRVGRE